MRQFFGIGSPGNGLDSPRSTEVSKGTLVSRTEDAGPDVAEVIAQCVARIGRAAPIAEDVRLAVQFGAEPGDVGLQRRPARDR